MIKVIDREDTEVFLPTYNHLKLAPIQYISDVIRIPCILCALERDVNHSVLLAYSRVSNVYMGVCAASNVVYRRDVIS